MTESLSVLAVKIAHRKGYRVSEDGRVTNPRGNEIKGYVMRSRPWKGRYRYFSLYASDDPILRKRSAPVKVHRLQAYQRWGDFAFADGLVVRHLDGDGLNNHIRNLALGSQSDNMMDRPAQERAAHALIAARSLRRFSDAEVCEIREDHRKGMSYNRLREKWACSKSTLSFILSAGAKRRAQY